MGKFSAIALTLITFITVKTRSECNETLVVCIDNQGNELGWLLGSSQKTKFGCMVNPEKDGPAFCSNCLSEYPSTQYVRAWGRSEVDSWHTIGCGGMASGQLS